MHKTRSITKLVFKKIAIFAYNWLKSIDLAIKLVKIVIFRIKLVKVAKNWDSNIGPLSKGYFRCFIFDNQSVFISQKDDL
jgi:hypothetical protein